MVSRLAISLLSLLPLTLLTVLTSTPGHAAPGRKAGSAQQVVNVAHRGASAYAPENTLAAVRLGVDMGADFVEVDVQMTKDGHLVLMHDTTLKRTTDAEVRFPRRSPWSVKDFTLRQIRLLDAGSWYDEDRFRGEKVPTLAEVLDTLESGPAGLVLEVKKPELYPGIGQKIADQLAARPAWRDGRKPLIVQSFDWDFIRDFRQVMPNVALGLIGTPSTDSLASHAQYADLINPKYGSFDAAYLRRVHERGMRAYGWTIDDPAEMRDAVELGVDGLISNRPDVVEREWGSASSRAA